MKKTPYWQLLQDPRWQKKRIETMERDGFMCQACATREKTLSVHHTYYVSGRMPWEYPSGTLVTLCTGCHSEIQSNAEHEHGMWELAVGLFVESENNSGTPDLILGLLTASRNTGWPDIEILHAFVAACEYGVIDAETLKGWNSDVSAIRKGVAK